LYYVSTRNIAGPACWATDCFARRRVNPLNLLAVASLYFFGKYWRAGDYHPVASLELGTRSELAEAGERFLTEAASKELPREGRGSSRQSSAHHTADLPVANALNFHSDHTSSLDCIASDVSPTSSRKTAPPLLFERPWSVSSRP